MAVTSVKDAKVNNLASKALPSRVPKMTLYPEPIDALIEGAYVKAHVVRRIRLQDFSAWVIPRALVIRDCWTVLPGLSSWSPRLS